MSPKSVVDINEAYKRFDNVMRQMEKNRANPICMESRNYCI